MKIIRNAILVITVLVLANGASAKPVIEEGVLVDGIEGVLKKRPNVEVWSFIPDKPIIVTKEITYPAGEPVEMLPCSVLEQMTGLSGEKDHIRVQLWALFTEYQHINFLYSVYFLPLQETPSEQTDVQNTEEKPVQEETATTKPEEPEQEDSIIPTDILKQIKSSKTPDLKKFQQVSVVTGDVNLIGRSGYLSESGRIRKFEPDALGLKVDGREFFLLPNSMLEEARKEMVRIPGKQRYNVSGLVTQYKGKTYMLLRRAVRTYSHGNFRN